MNHTNPLSLADITTRLCLLLDDMIQEWDMELLDPINADTRLIEDLGFESVDLMQLIGSRSSISHSWIMSSSSRHRRAVMSARLRGLVWVIVAA